jgi:hypothetical protein
MTQLWNLFALQNTAKVYWIDNNGALPVVILQQNVMRRGKWKC